jgi:mannose-6-phosphate isomerase-like protein (cupin superfamily)
MAVYKMDSLGSPTAGPHGESIVELLGRGRSREPVHHSVALATIPAGKSSINHYHPVVEESYYLLSGEGVMDLGEETTGVAGGDIVLIPPGVSHKITNSGSEVLRMLVVCVPPWDPDCSVFLEKWDGDKLVPDYSDLSST